MHRKPLEALPNGLALLLIGVVTFLSLAPARPAAAEQPTPPEPTVIQADNGSVLLTWQAPSFSMSRTRSEDGRLRSLIEAPGWPTSGVPGEPALPYATAVVAVPPTGEITLDVEEKGAETLPLSAPLQAAPASRTSEAYGQPSREQASGKSEIGSAGRAVRLEELGWLRNHRLVRLTFFPVRYDEQRGALNAIEEVQVRLRFGRSPEDGAEPMVGTTGKTRSDPFVSLLEDLVVNPEQVQDFTRDEEAVAGLSVDALDAAADGSERYKIAVTEEGLYELTYEMARDAGLPLDQAPQGLRLRHAGQDVAYQWDGDGDDAFEDGERILFYARPAPSRWAAHDVYWLSAEGNGTLMTSRPGDPASVDPEGTLWTTAEEERNEGERNYLSAFRSERDGDHWYWDRLWREYEVGEGDADKRFDVALLEPANGSEAALRLYLQGTSSYDALDPDHRVTVSINGNSLGQITWDGKTYYSATLSVPITALQPDQNQVRLMLPGNGAALGVEAMWLDAIEIEYPISGVRGQASRMEGEAGRNKYTLSGLGDGAVRIYDVSRPHSPQIVTGATVGGTSVTFADADADVSTYYVVTENQIRAPEWIEPGRELPEPSGDPDYLIVSHSDFIPAIAPLAEHRATVSDLTVHTVPVGAVYDVFGDGRLDPEAIKAYVRYAYEQWGTQYLLLVGDGTHDPLNNYGSPDHRATFIPPYLAMVDPKWGEAPSDNRFATLDGDRIPELFVGRLPVNTPAEAETVVAKILAYHEASAPGPWNEPLLFFAGAPDGGSNFHAFSDEIYENVRQLALKSQTPQRLYYCEEGCNETYQIPDEERMREAVLSTLNRGALMATWTGHSSWHQWGSNRLFHLDDLPNLRNGDALPVFLQMTCFTSYFSQPTGDTLDESLLRMADGGAIATWGPTSLGQTTGHIEMHKAFTDATLGDPSGQLGPATVTARFALDTIYASLWDTYALFGDPAMGLNLDVKPWAQTVHLPLVTRGAGAQN
jgi:hypothetical protein